MATKYQEALDELREAGYIAAEARYEFAYPDVYDFDVIAGTEEGTVRYVNHHDPLFDYLTEPVMDEYNGSRWPEAERAEGIVLFNVEEGTVLIEGEEARLTWTANFAEV